MNRFLAYLLRLIVILLGYIAASLATSAFIHAIFLASAGFSSDEVPRLIAGSIVFSIPFVALFVAYFAFVPATVVVLVGEVLKRRGWLYYALGGAFCGLVFIALLLRGAEPDFPAHNMNALLTIVGGGIAGGIAYWVVAGRWAGGWLDLNRRPAPISREPSGS